VPALGITGGIATGKSTFVGDLRRHLPAAFFDSDQCAHELLAHDASVHRAVRTAFGAGVFNADGQPDRAVLRQLVFADPAKRRELESILHPIIRQRWTALVREAKESGSWLFVDIPLLFETKAEDHFAAVIVVACTSATQRHRLQQQRRLTEELAEKILASQLALSTKIAQADHLIWNDSSPSCLDRQAGLLARWLRQRYH
jgi:dephospho-CoA kinase